MHEGAMKGARVISVVAATCISLACGTNYAYSAWAPEFAEKLRLSSTQSNLVGNFGNFGMYIAGIPVGIFVDKKGGRPAVFLGSVLMGIGYFFEYKAYDGGPQWMSIPWLCFFSFMTGVGGCAAFAGSIKTAAINWPDHRGSATAFPLAAYGLSAFFFSLISHAAFPDDTSKLLLVLTILTFTISFIGAFFLNVISQNQSYIPVPNAIGRNGSDASTRLKATRSAPDKHGSDNLGTQSKDPGDGREEIASLLSRSSGSSPGDLTNETEVANKANQDSHRLDIRGLSMLTHVKFWQQWCLLGILTGIGLMTINNIGNDARALWHHYDDSATSEFIQERQMMHVEILSIMSFCGRLTSGVGSDLIVRKLHMSRLWCLFISAFIFFIAQICGFRVSDPNALVFVSSLNGLAYGFLFGCCPALVAETFGIHGLSQNWGCMTIAPIISGNIFNLIYGAIYDRHSVILQDGARDCRDGLGCYQGAYLVTLGAAFVALGLALWSIWWDWNGRRRKGQHEYRVVDHEA